MHFSCLFVHFFSVLWVCDGFKNLHLQFFVKWIFPPSEVELEKICPHCGSCLLAMLLVSFAMKKLFKLLMVLGAGSPAPGVLSRKFQSTSISSPAFPVFSL